MAPPRSYPRGSGFLGLTNYLGLNQEAGQRMGSVLAQEVSQAGAPVAESIRKASEDFTTKAVRGTPTYDEGTAMLEPGALGEAARQGRIVYSGPKDLSEVTDVANLEGEAQKAEDFAKQAGSEAGISALYQERHGSKGGYSQGASMLDAALTSRGGGATLKNAAKGYAGLLDMLGVAKSGASASVANGKQGASELSEKYKKEFPAGKPYTAPPPLPPTSSTEIPEYLKAPPPEKKKRPWYDPFG